MLLNPNAGARQGRRIYQRVVAPLFQAAGIRLMVRETKRPAHAHVMAAGLTAEQLRGIDGGWAAASSWRSVAGWAAGGKKKCWRMRSAEGRGMNCKRMAWPPPLLLAPVQASCAWAATASFMKLSMAYWRRARQRQPAQRRALPS